MTYSEYDFTEITENSQLTEPNFENAEVFFNLRPGQDLPKKPMVPQPTRTALPIGQFVSSTPMGLYARRNMITPASKATESVNDMYAKVHKNRGEVDNLPMGASAMRTSKEHLLGARSRHHINYSDYEVAHYDPSNKAKKDLNEVGYETVPEKVLPPTR